MKPISSPVDPIRRGVTQGSDIYDLQRRLPPAPQDLTSPPAFVFSEPSAVTVGLFSPARYPQPTVAKLIIIDLMTAGSTDTDVDFRHNGAASFITVTVVAGANVGFSECGEYFAGAFDYLQADVTSAGTGAAGMSIHVFTNR